MPHDAFISYAFEDKAVADALCEKLEAAGIGCWIAPRDPRPGLPYGAQIVQAIAQSRIELLVFSNAANGSRAVLGEIEVGANREKVVLPLRIENVEPVEGLEYYIRAVQWFDATKPPLDARLSEVVGVVRDILNESRPRPAAKPAQTNLPSQVTSFVGREAEVVEIAALLEAHRIVTIAGSAGVGKTRASLQVAANLLEAFDDGVWFVELAPLRSGDYIPSTVAQALGITLAPGGDPLEQLVGALEAKRTLLVFDNCEHLVEPARQVISTILRRCPQIKILASSRQALGVAGEHAYRLPSLSVPADAGPEPIQRQDAARYAAVALFVERAIATAHHFALTDENAQYVTEICRRLDGIPLAIELAAARVNILSPRQLRDRLDDRFGLLTRGSHDALPRQQTLRALIDWSYDLLDERERAFFRRLGIFVGGFTLDGASAVGSGDGIDETTALDVLASLVDKSLVLAEPAGDSLRYRLLESTRAYALEKLVAAGEHESIARRHLRYLRDLFAEARDHYERTARGADLAAALATEIDDVRAALDWALDGPDALLGGELLAATGAPWSRVGLNLEGLARIGAFLTKLSDAEPELLARLWLGSAWLAVHAGHTASATEAATRAVAYSRESGDSATLAETLGMWSITVARVRRFDEADVALREAEAISGASARSRLRLLETRALLSRARGDLDASSVAYERLRTENRALGNVFEERIAALQLAEVEHARGETRRACAVVEELLPALRTQTDRTPLAVSLVNLAGYFAAVDELRRARDAAREAIEVIAAREPESAYVAGAIEHIALTFALDGEFSRAGTLAGYVDAAYQGHGLEREFTEAKTHDRLLGLLRQGLSSEELARLSAAGAALRAAEAIAEAVR